MMLIQKLLEFLFYFLFLVFRNLCCVVCEFRGLFLFYFLFVDLLENTFFGLEFKRRI